MLAYLFGHINTILLGIFPVCLLVLLILFQHTLCELGIFKCDFEDMRNSAAEK